MPATNTESRLPSDSYGALLREIKDRIRSAQYAALRAVNRELIELYWDIARLIVERQAGQTWGRSVVQNLAKDLQVEFRGVAGFSAPNLSQRAAEHLYAERERSSSQMAAAASYSWGMRVKSFAAASAT